MRSRAAPRFGPNRKIIYVYDVVKQMHGGSTVTEELRVCQAKLRVALDAVPLGIILTEASEIFRAAIHAGQNIGDHIALFIVKPMGASPVR